jgi:hypothetical protein
MEDSTESCVSTCTCTDHNHASAKRSFYLALVFGFTVLGLISIYVLLARIQAKTYCENELKERCRFSCQDFNPPLPFLSAKIVRNELFSTVCTCGTRGHEIISVSDYSVEKCVNSRMMISW